MRIVVEIPDNRYEFFRELIEMMPFAKVLRNPFSNQTVTAHTWEELSASMGKDNNVVIPDMDVFYDSLPDYLKEDGSDIE